MTPKRIITLCTEDAPLQQTVQQSLFSGYNEDSAVAMEQIFNDLHRFVETLKRQPHNIFKQNKRVDEAAELTDEERMNQLLDEMNVLSISLKLKKDHLKNL